ncbi:amino acid adenylation domain-containing protein [Rhizobium gallicum bv. gallicum R602sp]|uniref:Amino acid adenylation domain-containing protein n=2 Tax=Rhizobium TaxID=379 RepID=A0A0B4X4S1_9HYPH|nr:hybrid non-ribosomal peptide synthetase/type I polyketide synthase [Rhizobium gallicum]AJD42171.1 amino acid adenylation domain-containing protein [Rhizobium gallicum bv. gallicum R602sp]
MTATHETAHADLDRIDIEDDQGPGGIAIIGMSGRFPGAPSVEALWELVRDGRNAFSIFAPDEIEDCFTDEERAAANYVAARPHLPDVDMFDAEFFGMFAREAALTDPQHRVFLEICWEALENGGYDPHRFAGMIGVFAGSSMPTYLINNVLGDRAKAEEFASNYQIGCFQQLVGALNDALATRIAYKFDLRGPAFTLQSACSTSLLAVSQACQNLQTYACDMALAGGVSITLPQKRGYLYQEGGMASADGTCRPFDANADGTVFASGAGVVLLKRLEDARRDRDRIFAVIRGYGINNDGSDKVGFTAPSVRGQAEAISAALANAGVPAASIGYVECHGTATPLGDPIEFGGLKEAYLDIADARESCALGSVKGNVGHMDCAAGVSGLIKTALMLHRGKIPPMPNYSRPNPRLNIEESPFYIPTEMTDWPAQGHPRRAGVSAFGVGGTNVHVILEEAIGEEREACSDVIKPYILPLSARNQAALSAMRANLSAHLTEHPEISLADVAATLQNGRCEFSHRFAISARTVEEAREKLGAERTADSVASDAPPVAFMFPGQGAQYVGMGAGLYDSEPEFARWIDRGAELLKPMLGLDLRIFICHCGPVPESMADEQRNTRIAQPCLYLVEYALARLWMSRGLRPYAMIGHSVGEFVAATLANAISFEDGLRLVASRGRLMQSQPQGAMVSVRADAQTVSAYLKGDVEIAAVNAPKLSVISGPFAEIDEVCSAFEVGGIAFSRLHTSHAFHSPMMDEAAAALYEETAKVTYGTATVPYISCVTGDWQTAQQGTSPHYWARHCRDAVHFADGLAKLCDGRKPILLEVGPGRTLSVFASQTVARDNLNTVIQSLPEHDRAPEAADVFAGAQGRLWMAGCVLEWPELPNGATAHLDLPVYPFQRQRHWIDAPPSVRRNAGSYALSRSELQIVAEPSAAIQMPATVSVAPAIASSSADRIPALECELLATLAEMSGNALRPADVAATFIELGFDSLFIGQFAQRIEKDYRVKISFRDLLSTIPSIANLAKHLDEKMPEKAPAASPPPAAHLLAPAAVSAAPEMPLAPTPSPSASMGEVQALIQSQIQLLQSLFAQQLQLLQSSATSPPAAVAEGAAAVSLAQAVLAIAPAPAAAVPPGTAGAPVTLAQRLGSVPLTEAQTEIWLAAQTGDEASCSFNLSISLTLDGEFDEAAFSKALSLVTDRHDALRIRFSRAGDSFRFADDFALKAPLVDLAGQPDGEAQLREMLDEDARTPFDLVDGPLVRAFIARLAVDKHVFVFSGHHIICDGWSISVLLDELAMAYAAFRNGETPQFEPALSFATYATELAPTPEKSEKDEQFWLDQFKEIPELPELPLDRTRPEHRNFASGTCTGYIEGDVYKALKKAGAHSGATLFSTLLAMLQVVVSRLSGQEDIVIAVPAAGQNLIGEAILFGHCVNLLPIRQTVTSQTCFGEHLRATQRLVLQAVEHQSCTYGTLVRKLGVKRDSRRLPLTEIQFNLDHTAADQPFGNLTANMANNVKGFSNFDMFFCAFEEENGVRIDVEYNAEVFDRSTIERWIQHFATLAEALSRNIDVEISRLPLLSDDERGWLIDGLNDTAANYPRDEHVASLFARKASKQPDAVAAEHGGRSITYGRLEARSNQFARYIQEAIPEPGQRIALLVDRSLDMVVALLAIMKAGHTYVPMDLSHPEERLCQTLDVARVGGLICDSDAMASLAPADIPVIRIDEEAKAIGRMTSTALDALPPNSAAPAYVIFTSGSTGAPKGVEVSHQALTNFLLSMAKEPGFTDRDTILAVTTISFDIAGLELYLPLVTGGKMVIADRQQVQDGFAIVDLVEKSGATVLQATPTLWQMLVEAGLEDKPHLKMLCGGEPMPKELAKSLLKIGGELWNMYGPTETTVWSSVARITDAEAPITIGHPIANTQLHIVGGNNDIAPIGVTGELCIGGDGLANGYFDRLDLTEKAFVPISFGSNRSTRLYRTGDVGRRLANGSLQLLGRRDQQIKLRGFRIELGDIEAVVSKAPGVRHCAVVAAEKKSDGKLLVGYIVPEAGAEPSAAELSDFVTAKLPRYMVPTYWVTVSELPQTGNGKLDRKTLQQRGIPAHSTEAKKTKPRTPMEVQLAAIWQDILGSQDIGVDDNLYALGADSLTIFRMAARMLDANLPLEAKHLLRYPSIAQLARFAEQQIRRREKLSKGLSSMWCSVLNVDQLQPDDDFFALGGNSVLAAKLLQDVEATYKIVPNPEMISKFRTFQEFTAKIAKTLEGVETDSSLWELVTCKTGSSDAVVYTFNHPFLYYALATEIDDSISVHNLNMFSADLTSAPADMSVEDIARQAIEAMKIPAGTRRLALVGLCVNGILVMEISRQLREIGIDVRCTAAIDSWCPTYVSSLPKSRLMWWQTERRAKRVLHFTSKLVKGDITAQDYFRHFNISWKLMQLLHVKSAEPLESDRANAMVTAFMNSAAAHHNDPAIRDSSIVLVRSQAHNSRARKLRFGWRNAVAEDTPVLDLEGWHEDSLIDSGKALANLISARLGASSDVSSGGIAH